MLKYPLFPAVAGSHRREILPPLAAIALLGSMMLLALGSITPTASAEPWCDGPNPPPICFEDPEEPEAPEAPEAMSLTATVRAHGTVTISQGEPNKWRNADPIAAGQPFHLAASINTQARTPTLTVTEDWACGWMGGGSGGFSTTTYVRQHTIPAPGFRCPGEGLGYEILRVTASDPAGQLPPTGALTIDIYGAQWWEEYLPAFPPW
jgi:hypothetical protein